MSHLTECSVNMIEGYQQAMGYRRIDLLLTCNVTGYLFTTVGQPLTSVGRVRQFRTPKGDAVLMRALLAPWLTGVAKTGDMDTSGVALPNYVKTFYQRKMSQTKYITARDPGNHSLTFHSACNRAFANKEERKEIKNKTKERKRNMRKERKQSAAVERWIHVISITPSNEIFAAASLGMGEDYSRKFATQSMITGLFVMSSINTVASTIPPNVSKSCIFETNIKVSWQFYHLASPLPCAGRLSSWSGE